MGKKEEGNTYLGDVARRAESNCDLFIVEPITVKVKEFH